MRRASENNETSGSLVGRVSDRKSEYVSSNLTWVSLVLELFDFFQFQNWVEGGRLGISRSIYVFHYKLNLWWNGEFFFVESVVSYQKICLLHVLITCSPDSALLKVWNLPLSLLHLNLFQLYIGIRAHKNRMAPLSILQLSHKIIDWNKETYVSKTLPDMVNKR